MPMYQIWNDTLFYAYGAAGAVSLAALAYSIKRWLALRNTAPYEAMAGESEPTAPHIALADAYSPPDADTPKPLAQESQDPEKTVVVSNIEELIARTAEAAAEPPSAGVREELPPAHDSTRAEELVKGIYGHMAGIDARLGAIEETIAKGGGNRHFTVKFLEGILEDYDALSMEKIKARVKYLVSDLKENAPPAGSTKDQPL
ncbi:MAG: hypothetical protein A2285_00960 [Elusimicrobia bacterium RIFOXYA12_FULL_57_11]|nr:MAG: hypothetical protein A2285_00960 [Elusimicrobia bacterium RIFOXYA12_FULL_57_11]